MAITQTLKIWASTLIEDAVKGNVQRRELSEEEWTQGWLRLFGVTAQQLNSLFNTITHYSPPSDICPYLVPDAVQLNSETLLMDGQTLTIEAQPNLYNAYGDTLTDIQSSAPAGFKYVVRNH